jgi:hypothetical protein
MDKSTLNNKEHKRLLVMNEVLAGGIKGRDAVGGVQWGAAHKGAETSVGA